MLWVWVPKFRVLAASLDEFLKCFMRLCQVFNPGLRNFVPPSEVGRMQNSCSLCVQDDAKLGDEG